MWTSKWSRIKSAWAVLTGRAFATNYITMEQCCYYENYPIVSGGTGSGATATVNATGGKITNIFTGEEVNLPDTPVK